MTVLQRFTTDEHGMIELGYNGTSIEVTHDGVTYMVRPEVLAELLEQEAYDPREYPSKVAKEEWGGDEYGEEA